MAVIISGIGVPFETDIAEVYQKAAKKAGLSSYTGAYVAKSSVDARKRSDIQFVYTIGLHCENEEAVVEQAKSTSVTLRSTQHHNLTAGDKPMEKSPVVVGFGPAGMFAALTLARQGFCPIVIERGAALDARVEQVSAFWTSGKLSSSNVQFGEGGAGTFSDGKLTTRINDPLCEHVLEVFVNHGAPESIMQRAKPHIGTDYLREVVKSIREEIVDLGGVVHFETKLTGFKTNGGKITAVCTDSGDIETTQVILAIGHSARDTFAMLHEQGIELTPKAFSVGVRIEHLQSEIDKGLYGESAGNPLLPKGEYQLSMRDGGRGVYTFCMCPGGIVVPAASEEGGVVTNGMSEYSRSAPNANSAVAVSVDSADFGDGWDAGIKYQQRLERAAFEAGGGKFRAPAQTVGKFLAGKSGLAIGAVQPSYSVGVHEADLSGVFTPTVTKLLRSGIADFGRKLPAFRAQDAVLTGVETRTSSPVRISRNDTMQSVSLEGLYPCGEGSGYAGGIMSSCVDGIKAASKIVEEFRPIKNI